MTTRKILMLAVALILRMSTAAAQEGHPGDRRVTASDGQASTSSYRLGPDDQIVIQVSDAPDITGKPQRLDPNGDLRLPMIGTVHAAGMTLAELEHELSGKLKVYLQEPDVAVSVTEFRSQPVSVIGAVITSGVHQLEGHKTLIEILSLAGGIGPDAGPTVRIARRLDRGAIPITTAKPDASGEFNIAEIDLRSLLDGTTPDRNVLIQPHDVISIPPAELVFVIGEVGKPGPVRLSSGNSVSVMEAVSSAGGVLRTGATSRARIVRRPDGTQKRDEVSVDLKRVMQGKTEDVSLGAGDILIVPDSTSRRAAARVLEAAIQAGVIISTYGVAR